MRNLSNWTLWSPPPGLGVTPYMRRWPSFVPTNSWRNNVRNLPQMLMMSSTIHYIIIRAFCRWAISFLNWLACIPLFSLRRTNKSMTMGCWGKCNQHCQTNDIGAFRQITPKRRNFFEIIHIHNFLSFFFLAPTEVLYFKLCLYRSTIPLFKLSLSPTPQCHNIHSK